MINKRGQFYLIAAVIIIAIILGFVVISNYSRTDSSTKLYDLGEQLEIESAEVLDYGTYNELDEVDMENLWESFIEAYSDFGEIEKLYFIFGNTEEIIVLGYQDLVTEETIFVNVNGDSPLKISKETPASATFSPSGKSVTIIINDIKYKFDLEPGENFYFILFIDVEGDKHVVTN